MTEEGFLTRLPIKTDFDTFMRGVRAVAALQIIAERATGPDKRLALAVLADEDFPDD